MRQYQKTTQINFISLLETITRIFTYQKILLELKFRLLFILIISFIIYKLIIQTEEFFLLLLLDPLLNTINECEFIIQFSFNKLDDVQKISKIFCNNLTIIFIIPLIIYQFWLFIKPAYKNKKRKKKLFLLQILISYYFFILYFFYTNTIFTYTEECLNQINFLTQFEKLTDLSQKQPLILNVTLTTYVEEIESLWHYYLLLNILNLIILFFIKQITKIQIPSTITTYFLFFILLHELLFYFFNYTKIEIFQQLAIIIIIYWFIQTFKTKLKKIINLIKMRKTGFEPA